MKESIFDMLLKLAKRQGLTTAESEIRKRGNEVNEDAKIIHMTRDISKSLTFPIHNRSVVPGGIFGSDALQGAIALFNYSLLNNLPISIIPSTLEGTIPAIGEPIAAFKDQNDTAEDCAMTMDNISFSPKRITAFLPFSRMLSAQSPDIQNKIFFHHLALACSNVLDKYVFGVGARSATVPQGIGYAITYGSNTAKNSVTPSWAQIMGLEYSLDNANALAGSPAFITNPRGARHLKETAIETGHPARILTDGKIDNIPVYVSNAVSNEACIEGDADLLILCNSNELALITFGGVTLTIDDLSRAKEDIITIIADMFIDVKGLRAPLATSNDESSQTNDYSTSFAAIGLKPLIGNQS
jgi:hypothetical protein